MRPAILRRAALVVPAVALLAALTPVLSPAPSDAAVRTGTNGPDVIHGTPDDDLISGGPGRDRLLGHGDNDTIYGGPGRDVLGGGDDGDRLHGGTGADRLTGGDDNDLLVGGGGDDLILARDGEGDDVRCGPGRDRAVVDQLDRLTGCEVVQRQTVADTDDD